jgi:hypothetical protein
MKLDCPRGNYFFLPSSPPYSAAVSAAPGFELVNAILLEPLPLEAAMKAIRAHLAACGRPLHALCALELRCPAPYSFAGFAAFNQNYVALLAREGLLDGGPNPIARTNVAPVVHPPASQVVHAFTYSTPSAQAAPSFLLSGAGELVNSALDASAIVRPGQVSPDALAEKAHAVMDIMESRLRAVDAGWADVTAIQVYTAHDVFPFLRTQILERAGVAARLGIRWCLARPPVHDIEFEMDLQGVARQEICRQAPGAAS